MNMLSRTKLFAVVCFFLSLLVACGGEPLPDNGKQSLMRARSLATVDSSATHEDLVQLLYVGYFGRPADFGGRDFYAALYRAANAPTNVGELAKAYGSNPAIVNLVDSFGSSQESRDLYAGDTNAFVAAVYRNLFSRTVEPAGLAYWSAAIDNGYITRANAAITIMSGAQGDDRIAVERKLQFAKDFYQALTTDERRRAYSGNGPNAKVRNALVAVTAASDPAGFSVVIEKLLAELVEDHAFAISYADGASSAKRGKIVMLDVKGRPSTSLRVLIGQRPVVHQTIGGRIVFAVPEILPGTHALTVIDKDRSASLPLTVVESVLPFAPRTYVDVALAELDRQLALALVSAGVEDALEIRRAQQQLVEFRSGIAAKSDEIARITAQILDANDFLKTLNIDPQRRQSALTVFSENTSECDAAMQRYPMTVQATAFSLYFLSAGWYFANPEVIAIGAASSFVTIIATKRSLVALLDACIFTPANTLLIELVPSVSSNGAMRLNQRASQQVASVLGFQHDRSRTVSNLIQPAELPSEVATQVRNLLKPLGDQIASIRSLSSIVASIIPQSWETELTSFETRRLNKVAANLYRIDAISDSRVEGSYSATGASGVLRFKFKKDVSPKDPVPFTFSLVSNRDNSSGTFSATLSIPPLMAISYLPERSAFPIKAPITETWQTGQIYVIDFAIRNPVDRVTDLGMDSNKIFRSVDGKFLSESKSVDYPSTKDGEPARRTNITASGGILTITDTGTSSKAPPAYYPNGAEAYSYRSVQTLTYNIVTGEYRLDISGGQSVTLIDGSGNRNSNSSSYTGGAAGKVKVVVKPEQE